MRLAFILSGNPFKVALHLCPDELLMFTSEDDPLQGGVISLVALLDLPPELVAELLGQSAVLLRRPNLVLSRFKLFSSGVELVQDLHHLSGHLPLEPVHLLTDSLLLGGGGDWLAAGGSHAGDFLKFSNFFI